MKHTHNLIRVSRRPDAPESEAPLRTTEIAGSFDAPPTVGSSFNFFADSLTPGLDFRLISTSLVQALTPTGFLTMNSEYQLVPIEKQS